MIANSLIKKYNIAAPRYTSYPTVPYWDVDQWKQQLWLDSVRKAYAESSTNGISLYIHLPFCESLCTYCGCTTRITKNHLVEEPYLTAVIKEWLMYCKAIGTKPRIREIHLGGGTPTFFSPINLQRLVWGILEHAEIADDADFSFEAHPANTSKEHLQVLFDCGFRRLSLGIQDFDPDVQEIINRKQTVADVELVSKQAREIGYESINFDLIYGLPLQKLSSVEHTVSEVIKMRPDRIAYYSYAHVPWVKPGQRRFTIADLPEDEEKRALYERGREMLTSAGYHDIGMDHFALATDSLYTASKTHRLHRNFMGYTHQFTQLSIGLGASAISDSWYAYAQNHKEVESYIQQVSAGRFPLIKGHILTPHDLTARKHILNIMCKGKTTIDMHEHNYRTIISGLIPLQSDGLVKITDGNCVQVTETGKAFLRNICMCFDQRLQQNNPESQIFSKAV